jgi:hypothetical protein
VFGVAERLFGALLFRNVLCGAKHAIWLTRAVLDHVTLAVDETDFAVSPDDTVFDIVARFAIERLGYCLSYHLAIIEMDQFYKPIETHRPFLWLQPKDAISLVRPIDAIGVQIAFPVAEMCDVLGLRKFFLTSA